MNPLEEVLTALERVTGYRPVKAGDSYQARCPCHEDHHPSLSVKMNGRLLLHCFAGCNYDHILAALSLTPEPQTGQREIVATYRYRDAAGVEVRQKVRYAPKDFRIRHRDPAGPWVYKAGDGPAVLYRLPEVNAAMAEGHPVFLCEGEKDCDRLAALGGAATTNIEGAAKPEQNAKWRREYTAQLAGAARVVLLPDNDPPGQAHMQAIAQALRGTVGDLRLLELPELPAKGDVSDWLNQGHTLDELQALAATAPALLIQDPPTGKAEGDAIQDALLVGATGRSLIKHNAAADLLFKNEFDSRLFYDPITLEWLEYRPALGVFERRPQLAIEQAVYRAVSHHCGPLGFDASYVSGVTKCLLYEAIRPSEPAQGKICFRNGVLDLATRELLPHSPDHHFTSSLPFDWTPDAPHPTLVIDWLRETVGGHEDQVQLLRAYLNAIVVGRPDLQRFLELIGPGGTGKGTFIRLTTALVGNEASHSTMLKQLEENRFETANLFGKKLVVITDAEKWHGDVSTLKNITGQDAIPFEQKHKQAGESFVFGGMVIIAANQHTESTDYSSGIQRRRITVPFDHVVPVGQRRDLEAEFEPLLPAVLKWVLDMPQAKVTAYLRATSLHTSSLLEARIAALAATNPMVGWMLDNIHFSEQVEAQVGVKIRLSVTDKEGYSQTTTRIIYDHEQEWLYPNYCQWCDQNGKKPVSKNQFSTAVVDAARNMLGKPYVRYERQTNGRYIIGMTLEKPPVTPLHPESSESLNPSHDEPCQPMTTHDNLMTTQVIDCAEDDNLSTILEVTEFLNAESESEALTMGDAETSETAISEYGETCAEGRQGRHVQHNQYVKSSLGRHKVVIDDDQQLTPSLASTSSQSADASTPSTETDRRVIAALTLAGLSRKELRRASGMSEPEEVFNPRINRLLTAGYIGQRGGKLVPGHRSPPGVSP